MNGMFLIKNLIRKGVNTFGFDIIRLKNKPKGTLLGFHNLPINTVIDVGANEGQWGKGWKIEPSPFYSELQHRRTASCRACGARFGAGQIKIVIEKINR